MLTYLMVLRLIQINPNAVVLSKCQSVNVIISPKNYFRRNLQLFNIFTLSELDNILEPLRDTFNSKLKDICPIGQEVEKVICLCMKNSSNSFDYLSPNSQAPPDPRSRSRENKGQAPPEIFQRANNIYPALPSSAGE